MMNDKKKSVVPPQEQIEELDDTQLNEVSGGLSLPTRPVKANPFSSKPGQGQAMQIPTCFTKSDDHLP